MRTFALLVTLLLSTTISGFVHAQVPRACVALLAPLEAEVQSRATVVRAMQVELERVAAELDAIHRGMNWRERNLYSWLARALGGDAVKLRQRRDLSATHAQISRERIEARSRHADADHAVLAAASDWLRANEREFAARQNEYRLLCELSQSGASCLTQVDQAIADVDRAKSDDLIAGLSDNKIMEAIAASDTQDASSSIEAARFAVTAYIQNLNSIGHQVTRSHGVTPADHIRGIDGGFQFAIDWISGNSLMDWVNMYRLGNISSQLQDVRGRVASAHQSVEVARARLQHAIDLRLAELRAAAR